MIMHYRLTFYALCFSAGYFVVVVFFGIDIFELFVAALVGLEHLNVDEFVIPAVLLVVAVQADAARRNRADLIEVEKAKIYRAMIASVQHVLNNFLNQMQLFKLTADRTPGFDQRVLALYDQVIGDAVTQLRALASITRLDEGAIKDAVAPGRRAGGGVSDE